MRTYRTAQGDHWDIIAFAQYQNLGGEMLMDRLLAANPEHRVTVIFPADVILNIPEVAVPVATVLPPWKR